MYEYLGRQPDRCLADMMPGCLEVPQSSRGLPGLANEECSY